MIIKSPDTEDEFEQIYSLNYKTFVEEIPQHVESENKKLVDPFHKKKQLFNCYFKGKGNWDGLFQHSKTFFIG